MPTVGKFKFAGFAGLGVEHAVAISPGFCCDIRPIKLSLIVELREGGAKMGM
jgi:hypothetical protein